MENLTTSQDALPTELKINKQLATYLLETCKWAKFLGVFGFVITGFMVLAGLGFSSMMSFVQDTAGTASFPVKTSWFGIIYVLGSLFYFFPSLYTYRFASKTKKSLVNMSQAEMEEGFKNLKSLFKFTGMFLLIVLCFYGVILVGMMIGGAIGVLS